MRRTLAAEESIRKVVDREAMRLSVLAAVPQSQQARERSWPDRHPALFGALLGLGIGVGVELAVIPGASGGGPHSAYLPIFAGVGAGIGALTGVIVGPGRTGLHKSKHAAEGAGIE